MSGLEIVLDAITAAGRARGFIEVRALHRPSQRWTRFFVGVSGRRSLLRALPAMATLRDVYLAPAPRTKCAGTREAVADAWLAWADCDNAAAVQALANFPATPSVLVASGTPGHLHAYWRLSAPVASNALEAANRRLAAALGSDPAVANANAILRPPGTLNHKHDPPVRTKVVASHGDGVSLAELLSHCPPVLRSHSARDARRDTEHDALLNIEPEAYVRVLLGVDVPQSRKVRCPGRHEDRTPSLHVYATPERGWHCFGCGAGGSIYDLAALMWDIPSRGQHFIELRQRLLDRFVTIG